MKKKINTVLVCAAAALMLSSPASGEDGYIESDGNQYINLGHFIGPNTKIEFDFAMAETPTDNNSRPLGARGGQNCRVYFGGNEGEHRFSVWIASTVATSGQGWNSPVHGDTARHVMVIDYGKEAGKCTVSIDLDDNPSSNSKTFDNVPNVTATQPLIVFAENLAASCIYSEPSSTGYYMPAKAKVYGITISESGVEVKKFVPCVKGGIAGLKETHSGLFHTTENQLQHPLAYGGDILTEKDDPYIWSPRNDLNATAEKNIFIDTGYTVMANTRVELDYAMMTNYVSSWTDVQRPYLISSQTKNQNNSSLGFSFYAVMPGYMACHIGFKVVTNTTYGISTAHNVRRTVSMCGDGNLAVVTAGYTNLKWKSSNTFNPEHTFSPSSTLKIGSNFAGTGRHLPMKIYGMRIYESNNLVKDYVPFVANGVGGLRNSLDATDVIFSKTRINYSGAVSDGVKTNVVFDVGGNIACTDGSDEAYLEFDGANTRGHYVLTDYILTKDSRVDVDFSLWNTKPNSTSAPAQRIFDQSTANRSNCILARLYINSAWRWSVMYGDNHSAAPAGIDTGIYINNTRLKFTIDSYNSRLAVTNAGVEVYNKAITTSRTWETGVTNLWIGGSYGGTAAASMRLYSFAIYKKGDLDRNYVPCVRNGVAGLYETCGNKFLPVLGGKVSGATLKGQAFQIAPKPAKLTHKAGSNSATLTCFAAGAQSYEWYVDGVRIEGEVSDSLTIAWTNKLPHTRTYSVKPVYTVFNEKVVGEPVTATVEFTPIGTVICVQ